MRVGLIGCGKMGSIHKRVLDSLIPSGDVEAVRVYDNAMRGSVALNPLLSWADCFVVATPTPTHKHFVDMCIQLRKPVFCEKPFSDGCAAEDLCYAKWATRQNSENRALLFVGYIERYNAAVRRLGVLLNAVEADPTDALLYFITRRVNAALTPPVIQGREIVTDLGVHDFDILRCLFGSVRLRSARIIDSGGTVVFARSSLVLETGLFCDSVVSWIDIDKRREYIAYTKKKVIMVYLLEQRIVVLDRVTGRRSEFVEGIEPAYTEMRRFLRMVRDGAPLNVPDPIGLQAQKLAFDVLTYAEVMDR